MTLKLNHQVTADELNQSDFAQVVLATGILPRTPDIDGIDHPSVLSYLDVLKGAKVGKTVAVIGAGGIGFDVCEYITQGEQDSSQDISAFMAKWGVDMSLQARVIR